MGTSTPLSKRLLDFLRRSGWLPFQPTVTLMVHHSATSSASLRAEVYDYMVKLPVRRITAYDRFSEQG